MTELLIIKAGDSYYRVRESSFESCPFNKASVFTLTQADEAKDCCRRLQESGVAARLMKLTIVEQLYTE